MLISPRPLCALVRKTIPHAITKTTTVLIAVAVVAIFSYATGYEYSYNGKHLGYVNNQEDVTKVLGLVSEELSKEYGSNIQINEESDITFKSVFVLDKEIDSIDTTDIVEMGTFL